MAVFVLLPVAAVPLNPVIDKKNCRDLSEIGSLYEISFDWKRMLGDCFGQGTSAAGKGWKTNKQSLH